MGAFAWTRCYAAIPTSQRLHVSSLVHRCRVRFYLLLEHRECAMCWFPVCPLCQPMSIARPSGHRSEACLCLLQTNYLLFLRPFHKPAPTVTSLMTGRSNNPMRCRIDCMGFTVRMVWRMTMRMVWWTARMTGWALQLRVSWQLEARSAAW